VPSLSVADVSVAEGDAGPTYAFFTVSLSAPSGRPVSVAYATSDGTAAAGSDYAAASGTLSFPEGVATRTVALPVTADLAAEADETFTLSLSAPAFATIASGTGTATIVDDDPLPGLAISDASVTEGNAGLRTAVFKVTLSAASALPVTVGYATQDGSAVAGADYQARSGTLTFAPGDVARTIAVPVIGDTLDERTEVFLVGLGGPTNAKVVGGRAEGVIKDDDGAADAYTPIATLPYVVRAPGRYRLVTTPLLRMGAGAAITIAADDVVLDLQGGTLANAAGPGNFAFGVFAAGRKNVTVQHGTLRGFFTGVSLRAPAPYATAQGLVVRDVRVLGSTYAGIRTEGRGSTIVDCAAIDTGAATVFGPDAEAFGILAVGPAAHVNRNTVARTTPTGAGTAFGIALVQAPSGAVTSNGVQDGAAGEDVGIEIESSAGVSAYGNRLSNLRLGIVYATGSSGTFRGNDASDGVLVPYLGGTDGGRNR
jgi:parallel beta-helix repeat protein